MSVRLPERMIGRILSVLRAAPEPPEPILRAMRLRLRLPIGCRVSLAGRRAALTRAVLRNLSATGAFVETALALPTGGRLMLVLPLPERHTTLELTGEVRWARHAPAPGLGVRLSDLTPGERRLLERAFGPLSGRWETTGDTASSGCSAGDHDLTDQVIAPPQLFKER